MKNIYKRTDIIDLSSSTYYKNKYRTIRMLFLYLIVIVFLVSLNIYKVKKTYVTKQDIQTTKYELLSAKQALNKVIVENISINKTIFVLKNIKFGQDPSLRFYVNHMNDFISNFAYYYEIPGPISINFSVPKNIKPGTLNSMNIEMHLSSKSDEAIIKFIDALVINLKGFIKVQEMELTKNTDFDNRISCNLKLRWYIFISENEDFKGFYTKVADISPKKSPINVEDICRLSIWEGSLMLSAEENTTQDIIHPGLS